MYQLTHFINNKAKILDSVNDVTLTYTFDSYDDAVRFVIDKNKEMLKADLANYRYQKEVEGINYGGVVIRTDRESQAQFNAAYNAMKEGLTDTISWKGNGMWVDIDMESAKEIAQLAFLHVQKCFKCEKALTQEIDALNTISAVENFNIPELWEVRFAKL